MSDCVPVVFVDPAEMAELTGISEAKATKWLAKEENLGLIRQCLYPDPSEYDEAITEAYRLSTSQR